MDRIDRALGAFGEVQLHDEATGKQDLSHHADHDPEHRDLADRMRDRRRVAEPAGGERDQAEAKPGPQEEHVAAAFVALDEFQIAQVDGESGHLAQRNDQVTLVRGIGQQQGRSRQAEIPEVNRHQAAACAFRQQPLHQKARGGR